MNQTARYIGFDPQFNGSTGLVSEAGGFYDPESAEYGAFVFQPAGYEIALYCSREDWEAT